MKKSLAVLLSVLPLLLLVACSAPEPSSRLPLTTTDLAAEPTSPPPAAATEAVVGVSAVTEATVSIASSTFQPHTLIVATGTTVTWQNTDSVAHTISSGEGWFDSGQLTAGESFSHQFSQPGTFRYLCNNHPPDGGRSHCPAWRCGRASLVRRQDGG